MKTIKIILCLLMLSGALNIIRATQYLGLGYEPGQGKEQRKARIVDDYLYVPTSNGLFRKSVTTLNDTIWELYAFKGVPVRDFVKKNDSIIAFTTRKNDSLMLLSTDNGKTFIDYTSDYFKVPGASVYINLIQHNPLNKNSMLVLSTYTGLLKSTDFGKTWKNIQSNSFYSYHKIGINPNDTTNIICESITFETPYIFVSLNDGKDWNYVQIFNRQSAVIGDIFFYPDNQNEMLTGVDNWICKSSDKGNTWHKADKLDVTNLCFAGNTKNSMLYASGNSFDGKMKVYTAISYDGEFWFIVFNKPINDLTNAYDIHVVGDEVLLFTEGGVYNINVLGTTLSETKLDVSVVQTGTAISFKGTEIIESVRIYDISGKLKETFIPNNNKYTIDVSSYQKGLYLFEFGSKSNVLKKKVIVR